MGEKQQEVDKSAAVVEKPAAPVDKVEGVAPATDSIDRVKLLQSVPVETGAGNAKLAVPSAEQLASITKGKSETVKVGGAEEVKAVTDKAEKPLRLEPGTPVEEFVKTEPVRAERFHKAASWINTIGIDPIKYPNGKTETAEAGDWKIYEKDGKNFYVVKGDQFLKSYTPNPGFHRSTEGLGGQGNLPASTAGEYIKLGIVKAQKLPEGEWKTAEYTGRAGDYLLEDWQGKQYIVPKKEFEALYSPIKSEGTERESIRLPEKRSGQIIERPELGAGVTSEAWEKGQIIRDPNHKTVTITDTEQKSMSVYNADPEAPDHLKNRLMVKHEQVGNRILTRTVSYEHAERLAATQEAKNTLDELYKPGSKYSLIEQVASSLPDTMSEEYVKQYNQSPEGQKESREQLQKRLELEAIKTLIEGDGKVAGAKKVGFEDPQFRPRLDLVIGLPAAGKSTYIEKLKALYQSAEIESDLIKVRLPEFNVKPGTPEYERLKAAGIELKPENGLGAGSLMQESNLINDRVLAHMMKEGYNIVLPGVGLNKEWTEKFIKQAQAAGYDVHLSIIDTMPTDAIKGAIGRYERDGRYVSPRFIGTHGERPSQNFAYLTQNGTREGWLDGFKRIWNQGYVNKQVESSALVTDYAQTSAFERKLQIGQLEDAEAAEKSQTRKGAFAGVDPKELELLKGTNLEVPDKPVFESAARELLGRPDLVFTNKQLRDMLKGHVFLQGERVPVDKVLERVPADLKDMLIYRAGRGAVQGDTEAVKAVLEALDSNKSDIKDLAVRRLADAILAENAAMQQRAASARAQEVKTDMKASGMSLLALATVAAGILAYTHPQETEALVERLRKSKQGKVD